MPFAYPVHRTLVLVAQPEYLATDDLLLIRDKITAQAPDIRVLVVGRSDSARLIDESLWKRPALTVSFGPLGSFRPLRGILFCNEAIPKIEQFRRMTASGISTPRTAIFKFGMNLPPDEWKDFCILKPANLSITSSGRGIYLFRRDRLKTIKPEDLPPDHFARREEMLVQSFIDSGPTFKVYRCLTLFGEVIYQNVSEDPEPRSSLEVADEVIEAIVPEPRRSRATPRIDTDPRVMAFAASIHKAFADTPLLGCDIIQEEHTGDLYAIEVNAGGNVWHLSSPRTRDFRSISKIQEYLKTFKSYDKAALSLIRATRRHAA